MEEKFATSPRTLNIPDALFTVVDLTSLKSFPVSLMVPELVLVLASLTNISSPVNAVRLPLELQHNLIPAPEDKADEPKSIPILVLDIGPRKIPVAPLFTPTPLSKLIPTPPLSISLVKLIPIPVTALVLEKLIPLPDIVPPISSLPAGKAAPIPTAPLFLMTNCETPLDEAVNRSPTLE